MSVLHQAIQIKCGPNLDTQFCVEVLVEFYIYTPAEHTPPFSVLWEHVMAFCNSALFCNPLCMYIAMVT